MAFAPFLPQVDLLGQYGVVSDTLAPGKAGNDGLPPGERLRNPQLRANRTGLQWIVYDFGRTGGRYHQAVAREHIAELQLVRADQTVEFDVATAYLDVLLARAFRRVQEDAVRRAEAILDDTVARRAGGVALREDVLRAQVQLSESREALVLAREGEFDAVARLNNVMGRNAALPLEVIDLEVQPPIARVAGRPPGAGRRSTPGGRPGPATSGGGRRRVGKPPGASSCHASSSAPPPDVRRGTT